MMVMFSKSTSSLERMILYFPIKIVIFLKRIFKGFPEKQPIFWPKTIKMQPIANLLTNVYFFAVEA